ncbi:MAG: Nif11-like leader peptide family RiPP precursor [Pelotomaculum sp.]
MWNKKLVQLQAKLEADGKLGEKIFSQETPEQVQGVLKEAGLDFSLEEINQLRDLIVKIMEKGESGELSDEDLEGVAGGGAVATTITLKGFLDTVNIRLRKCFLAGKVKVFLFRNRSCFLNNNTKACLKRMALMAGLYR